MPAEPILIDSIYDSVRDQLGVVDDAFDPAIMMHINSVFSILYELGVGPATPYRITSKENSWSEFITRNDIELVKSYVGLRVRQLFDPPSTATMYEAVEKSIKELEWRLLVTVDHQVEESSDE